MSRDIERGSPRVGDLPFDEGQGYSGLAIPFTREGVFGLIPPRLDCRHGVPGWFLLDQ